MLDRQPRRSQRPISAQNALRKHLLSKTKFAKKNLRDAIFVYAQPRRCFYSTVPGELKK